MLRVFIVRSMSFLNTSVYLSPLVIEMSTFSFYLVHRDIWGPSNIPNILSAYYFITFIDDCTRVTWVYLLKQKFEVSHVVPQFLSMVKNKFGMSIKRIQLDNTKDYFNHTINYLCQNEGIIHESSRVKTPPVKWHC